MGKPAFIFTDYHPSATVTATDTLTGTDADNILLATEDTVWSPADAIGEKEIKITDVSVLTSFDTVAILGENLESVDMIIKNESGAIIQSEGETVSDPFFQSGIVWSFGTGWAWDGALLESASFSGAVIGNASQTITLEEGRYYRALVFATVLSDCDIEVKIGSVTIGVATSAGVFESTFQATAAMSGDLVIEANNLGATPAATIITAQVVEYQTLAPVNNVSIILNDLTPPGAGVGSVIFVIRNPSTNLQIAHIAPDTLIEQPWLEDDWGTEGVQTEFKNLISVDGYYLGTTQTKTMRDININFGEITDTEYIGQVKPWVDSRIKTTSAFFFVPDVDDLTEVYFCWLVDGQGFKAPLKQGVRMVEAIRCLTRLA